LRHTFTGYEIKIHGLVGVRSGCHGAAGYCQLAASTEPGAAHDLFEYLANEETEHMRELEKIYYELVHSGGV
jgi:hypothetical protein